MTVNYKPYEFNLLLPLKWQQQKAVNLQSLLNQKASWYSQFHTTFWSNYETDIFNLATANNFGLMIWCIILGVPSGLFGLYSEVAAWGFQSGPNVSGGTYPGTWNHRQNFINSTTPTPTGANTLGGNFIGGGNTTILNIAEVRLALRMRYLALVSNGTISFANYALHTVFAPIVSTTPGNWDYPHKQYFYCTDITGVASSNVTSTPPTSAFQQRYHVGLNLPISANLVNLLNSTQYGFMPSCAGSNLTVVRDT